MQGWYDAEESSSSSAGPQSRSLLQRAGENLGQAKYAADHLKATGGISRIGERP